MFLGKSLTRFPFFSFLFYGPWIFFMASFFSGLNNYFFLYIVTSFFLNVPSGIISRGLILYRIGEVMPKNLSTSSSVSSWKVARNEYRSSSLSARLIFTLYQRSIRLATSAMGSPLKTSSPSVHAMYFAGSVTDLLI